MSEQEEVEILSTELDRVRAELALQEEEQPSVLTRIWRRVFGRKVYSGPETCGHCKYWKIRKKYDNYWHRWEFPSKGDCKLLYGKEDTTKDGTCHRFKARRRYKHRER